MMTKIDHNKFDAEFLFLMVDHGINVMKYEYKRLEDQPEWTIGRQFGDNYFAFEFTEEPNKDTDWIKMAAERAAYRMRDKLQPWRDEIPVWMENYLDRLHEET
jgi:hypothetical protein